MRPNRMTATEIEQSSSRVPDWTVESNPRDALFLEWKGINFVDTFALMIDIAELAEELNHHPEWCNVYSRLTIRLTTHDVGGLSELDFKMAERIDILIKEITNGR